MNLPTLVVCDAGEDKTAQIGALVKAHAGLTLVGVSTMHETFDKIPLLNPKLIWIELTPDPDEGIKLLSALKEKHPELHCVVSNDILDADLVKMTMQIGAADFLDSVTWNDQLPDVIKRVNAKENEKHEVQARQEAAQKKMRDTLDMIKLQAPTTSKTNLSAMKRMRTDPAEIQSRAMMNLVLMVVVVLLAIGAFFLFKILK